MLERDTKSTKTGHSNGTNAGDISRAHALLTEGCPDVPGDTSGGTKGQGTGTVHASRVPSRKKLGAEARARIVASVQVQGLPVRRIAEVIGAHATNVRSVVARLCADGLVFTCRVCASGKGRHEVWVFGDMAQRDAFHAECKARSAENQRRIRREYLQRNRELHNERARMARARASLVKADLRQREAAARAERAKAALQEIERQRAAVAVRRAEREIAKQRERLAREARAAERARAQAEAKKTRERLKAETRAASQMAKASNTARPAPVRIGPALRADGPIIIPEGLVIQRAPTPPDRWAVSNPAPVCNSRDCRAWAKAVTA